MANRKRNIQVKFYVTAEEKELMEQKMAQLQTKRIGAYLRKMAIDGYIIYVDTRDITHIPTAPTTATENERHHRNDDGAHSLSPYPSSARLSIFFFSFCA